MQKLRYLLFSILFLALTFVSLFLFSTKFFKTQIFAENSLKVNDQVDVQIRFNSPNTKAFTAAFEVLITDTGELVNVTCGGGGPFSTVLPGDTSTSCVLGSFDGVNSGIIATAKIKAKSSGNLQVTISPLPGKTAIFKDQNATAISDTSIDPITYSIVGDNIDPASCFGQAFLYQKSPYEYKVNESMSATGDHDWVKFPLNSQCRSKQVLESIFGPLDDINGNGTVFITKPNQEFQYGFTFNRIVAIQGYNTDEIKAGEPGKAGLSEQQLNDLHQAGKDTQSIENCDYNSSQMVFDMVKNEAKPNMADYKPHATGYYQFDITPKFKCSGNNPNQQSLGAGFVRVTGVAPAVEVVCKNLVAIAKDSTGKVVDFSTLPNDFVGKITLTCEGKSKVKDINAIFFTFVKDGQLISGNGDGTPADKIVALPCTDNEIQAGYKCVVGSSTFDISGKGVYSASSKVCIVEGTTKICSPNVNN